MNNLMLDIETLGTKTNGIIISLALIPFDPVMRVLASKENSLFLHIDADDAAKNGGTFEMRTIGWWTEQSPEAVTRMREGQANGPLKEADACRAIRNYLYRHLKIDARDVRIWGNGARFDVGLVDQMFDRAGVPSPIKYNSDMCYRTIYRMGKAYAQRFGHPSGGRLKWSEVMPVGAVQHDPYDDSVFQILGLFHILDMMDLRSFEEIDDAAK